MTEDENCSSSEDSTDIAQHVGNPLLSESTFEPEEHRPSATLPKFHRTYLDLPCPDVVEGISPTLGGSLSTDTLTTINTEKIGNQNSSATNSSLCDLHNESGDLSAGPKEDATLYFQCQTHLSFAEQNEYPTTKESKHTTESTGICSHPESSEKYSCESSDKLPFISTESVTSDVGGCHTDQAQNKPFFDEVCSSLQMSDCSSPAATYADGTRPKVKADFPHEAKVKSKPPATHSGGELVDILTKQPASGRGNTLQKSSKTCLSGANGNTSSSQTEIRHLRTCPDLICKNESANDNPCQNLCEGSLTLPKQRKKESCRASHCPFSKPTDRAHEDLKYALPKPTRSPPQCRKRNMTYNISSDDTFIDAVDNTILGHGDTLSVLLTYLIKYLITPEEVKVFNISYFENRSPPLLKNVLQFRGLAAHKLMFTLNNINPAYSCQACSSLMRDIKAPNMVIPNLCSLAQLEHVLDINHHDVLLDKTSTEAGFVRLIPVCPQVWNTWAYYPSDSDNNASFVKCITPQDDMRLPQSLRGNVKHFIPCTKWPLEIETEFMKRVRKNSWLDEQVLKDIVACECGVVPGFHPNSTVKHIEWEFVFHNAEKKLSEILSEEHKLCFCVFQILLQHTLRTDVLLQIFEILETILFHVCDDIPCIKWKVSPGYCVTALIEKLHKSVESRCIAHYIVKDRNLLEGVPRSSCNHLLRTLNEMLKCPLRAFEDVVRVHKFHNEWILNEIRHGYQLIGGHSIETCAESVFIPLALRIAKEFMITGQSSSACECLLDTFKELSSSLTERSNPYTTDIQGFIGRIVQLDNDAFFLCQLVVYLKLAEGIDLADFFSNKQFTNLQALVGSEAILCPTIASLPFPHFRDDNGIGKVRLLEQIVTEMFQYSCYPSCIPILLCALESAKQSLTYIHQHYTESTSMDGSDDTYVYKKSRSLLESQFRILTNLFVCYRKEEETHSFDRYLSEYERLCEQLGEPGMYMCLSYILEKLDHAERAQKAKEMAQIRESVKFGI